MLKLNRHIGVLYTAERDYAVQKLTLERAEAVLKEAQLHEKAGLAGPNQVANAKTFQAEQRLLLIDREEQLDTQSDLLTVLTGKKPEPGNSRFLATDTPPSNFPIEPVDNLIDYALNNNLELKAAQNNIEIANTLVDAAGWKALPQVDLVGSLNKQQLRWNISGCNFRRGYFENINRRQLQQCTFTAF